MCLAEHQHGENDELILTLWSLFSVNGHGSKTLVYLVRDQRLKNQSFGVSVLKNSLQ